DQLGPGARHQPVVAPRGQALGRDEADDCAGGGLARVDAEVHEADERPRPVHTADERLLRVADAVRVDVCGLEDRQVAVGEWRGEWDRTPLPPTGSRPPARRAPPRPPPPAGPARSSADRPGTRRIAWPRRTSPGV